MKKFDFFLGYLQWPAWILLYPFRLINRKISSSDTICIIKLAAMGDLLCLYPTIFSLKEAGYKVVLVTTNRSNPSLFRDCNAISKVVLLHFSPKYFFLSILEILYTILTLKVCINADQYYNLSKCLSYICDNSVGFKTNKNKQNYRYPVDYSYTENEKYQFLKLASMVEPKITKILPKTDLFAIAKPESNKFSFQNCVILYPGSGPTAKMRRWPIDRWVQLFKDLENIGYKCIFVGGPDEEYLIPLLKHSNVPNDKVFINCMAIPSLIESMRHSSAFIGNDAGLFHIADALRLPIVGIFGPNISSKWGSVRPNSVHVEVTLPCRPCIVTVDGKVPNVCRFSNVECMKKVEVQQVIDAFKTLKGVKRFDN